MSNPYGADVRSMKILFHMEELDSCPSVYNGIEARMTRSTVFLLLKTLQIGVPTMKEVSSSDCDYDHGSDSQSLSIGIQQW